MFRTGNPALKESTFRGVTRAVGEEAMTLQGTVNKTGLSLLILLAAAAFVWNSSTPQPFVLVGLVGGLIAALVTVFKPTAAPITTPLYAAFEGLLLGGLSLVFEARYPGIVINAVGLTFGTLAVLLLAYSSGLIRPSENFKLGVVAATGAVALLYLVSMVLGFFGKTVPFIHDSGPIGIGFSLFVVGLAALNLVLDFDFIERGAAAGAPKYMEWFGAFGLLVTLVWLYIEILRLLAKLQDRRR
ncbi:MAG: hypothetical protein DMF78_06190 [Acidobacteria bacterium]|nr:MAG: hypothetical protein DMF78_06190 [Acidobacteriota bacterium]